MTRMEARGMEPRPTNWKRRITAASVIVFVLGASIAVRHYSGPRDVQAQAPSGRTPVSAGNRVATLSPTANAPAASGSQTVNIVASVNGQQITRQELADECLRRQGTDVLESLVNRHLIWEACQSKGITITGEDVEAEIARLAGKFGLSAGRWLTLLREERGITPEQYRREIIWPTLALRSLAAQQLEVTPDELRQAFEAEYGPRVRARAITVSSRERAEQLRALAVNNPDDFSALAKQHSEDQSASVHGLIPPIRKHMGNEDLERVAFGLREGEISPVIQVANQYVILKCEKHMAETYIADRFRADAEARIRDRIQDQKLRTATSSLFQELQRASQVVNVMNDPQLRTQMPGVAATINGHRITRQQLAEECIERYGREVLEGEINRRLLLQALQRKSLQVTEQDLDQEIARAADAYGYVHRDGSPDVEKWLEEVTKQEDASAELYIRDAVWPTVALKKLVDSQVEVSPEDIEKGFESNYGPRVEALAIVLNNHRQAQKVWEMARDNPSEEFFGELAHQYSVDTVSRENFGRVPPIRRFGGQPELEKEAFSLQPGELSGIIASEENYILLRCTGRTTPVVGALDREVRDELTKDIREKKLRMAMAVEFDRLQQSATVDNYLAGTFQSATPSGRTATPPATAAKAAGYTRR